MDIPLGHSAFDPLCLYGEGDSAVNLHIPKTKKHLHYHLRLQLPTRLAVASKAASPTAHHPDLPIRIPSPPHTRASGSNRTHHPCMISIQLPRPTTSPQPFQTARTTSAYPTSPPHTRPLFPNPSSMKVFHVVARARAQRKIWNPGDAIRSWPPLAAGAINSSRVSLRPNSPPTQCSMNICSSEARGARRVGPRAEVRGPGSGLGEVR